jgi:hypothetical protein
MYYKCFPFKKSEWKLQIKSEDLRTEGKPHCPKPEEQGGFRLHVILRFKRFDRGMGESRAVQRTICVCGGSSVSGGRATTIGGGEHACIRVGAGPRYIGRFAPVEWGMLQLRPMWHTVCWPQVAL